MTSEHILALVALATVVWMPLRVLSIHGIPASVKTLVGGSIVIYATTVVWITWTFPGSIRPLLLLVSIGWAIAIWRARPTAGVVRGQPPGSLGLHSSIQALIDYGFYALEFRRFGPVFKTNQYYRPVLCVVGLERCQEFLRDNKDRLTSAPLAIDRQISGGLLRYMEPEQHREYRRLLLSCMTPQVLSNAQTSIENITQSVLAAIATESATNRSNGVQPYDYIDRMVYGALAQVFFGIEPNSEPSARLLDLFRVVDHRRIWRGHGRTRVALESIVSIVLDQASKLPSGVQDRRNSFLAECIHHDSALLDDPILVENLAYFLHIARCDLDGLCGWLLKMVCDHPDWGLQIRRSRVEADGAASGDALVDRFVKETLRLRQSEYLYRTVSEPIEFEGFSVPSGWLVRLCIRESHTSSENFDKPEDFDPDRFTDTVHSQQQYQPFGIYEHACMGAGVTAVIGRVFVEQLVSGFDYSIVQDGPMELGLHHHGHWRPSSQLRVRLESLEEPCLSSLTVP